MSIVSGPLSGLDERSDPIFVQMAKLTIKQEKFCNKYLECGNASEAYRFAYDCSKMTDKSVWEMASSLLADIKVASRVREMQEAAREKSNITKAGNLAVLRSIIEDKGAAAAVRIRAIEVSNKMLGFDSPQKVEHTGRDGGPIDQRHTVENHKVIFERYQDA